MLFSELGWLVIKSVKPIDHRHNVQITEDNYRSPKTQWDLVRFVFPILSSPTVVIRASS